MTALAQSMLNGPPMMLSTAHLMPTEVMRWLAHQRVQLEAGTFHNRTLTTTISEKSWTIFMFKIETSHTLIENPSKNWCDITAHTVLLYVLFCLIYMYCTLYVPYILHTVHKVHVPCFPVSDVEVSSSASVHHTCLHSIYKFTYISSLSLIHLVSFTTVN